MNQLGQYLFAKGLLQEAEPLMRRALAIDEASYGAERPDVAIRLNNLAQLLQDTNRLWEAVPRAALPSRYSCYSRCIPGTSIRIWT